MTNLRSTHLAIAGSGEGLRACEGLRRLAAHYCRPRLSLRAFGRLRGELMNALENGLRLSRFAISTKGTLSPSTLPCSIVTSPSMLDFAVPVSSLPLTASLKVYVCSPTSVSKVIAVETRKCVQRGRAYRPPLAVCERVHAVRCCDEHIFTRCHARCHAASRRTDGADGCR
jgi:hypothetical protein